MPFYLRVREFGDDYWSKRRPKSLIEVTRYLTKTWQPLHSEPVDKITRQMVKRRRDEIVSESGPVAANRAHTWLNTFFAWAIHREYVSGANPTADIKALKEEERDRVLSEAELVDIWLACGDDDFGRIVKLLMLTGQCRREDFQARIAVNGLCGMATDACRAAKADRKAMATACRQDLDQEDILRPASVPANPSWIGWR